MQRADIPQPQSATLGLCLGAREQLVIFRPAEVSRLS